MERIEKPGPAIALAGLGAVLVAGAVYVWTIIAPHSPANQTASSAPMAQATIASPAPIGAGQPMAVAPFHTKALYNDRLMIGVSAQAGAVLYSPLAGTVMVYTGTDSQLPPGKVFGLMTITAADRTQIGLYFGEVDKDALLLVADKSKVTAGAPLLKIMSTGPSMSYFLAKNVPPYQVVGFWRAPDGTFVDVATKPGAFGHNP